MFDYDTILLIYEQPLGFLRVSTLSIHPRIRPGQPQEQPLQFNCYRVEVYQDLAIRMHPYPLSFAVCFKGSFPEEGHLIDVGEKNQTKKSHQ